MGIWEEEESMRHKVNLLSIKQRGIEIIKVEANKNLHEDLDMAMQVEKCSSGIVVQMERAIEVEGRNPLLPAVSDKYRKMTVIYIEPEAVKKVWYIEKGR